MSEILRWHASRKYEIQATPMNFVLENFLTISFHVSLSVENWPLLILSFTLSFLLYFHTRRARSAVEDVYRIRGKIEIFAHRAKRRCSPGEQATLIHWPIRSPGVQIPCRQQSIFINGSALTSPGTCVTVNAHSTERCGTLSLSMTDITHSRTFRRLLRIPYGNAARPISRTVHLWNWHRVNARALLLLLPGPHCLRITLQITGNAPNVDETLFTNARLRYDN